MINKKETNANVVKQKIQNEKLEVKVLQIWLHPDKLNIAPRYQQLSIKEISKKNSFYQILSPSKNDQGVWIHQSSWFSLGEF